MVDLIDRQTAINGKISIQRANGIEIYYDEVVPVEYLKALPSTQSERKVGKWTYIKNVWVNHSVKICRCSVCNRPSYGATNFCPNCGADMKEESDGTN